MNLQTMVDTLQEVRGPDRERPGGEPRGGGPRLGARSQLSLSSVEPGASPTSPASGLGGRPRLTVAESLGSGVPSLSQPRRPVLGASGLGEGGGLPARWAPSPSGRSVAG